MTCIEWHELAEFLSAWAAAIVVVLIIERSGK